MRGGRACGTRLLMMGPRARAAGRSGTAIGILSRAIDSVLEPRGEARPGSKPFAFSFFRTRIAPSLSFFGYGTGVSPPVPCFDIYHKGLPSLPPFPHTGLSFLASLPLNYTSSLLF